MRVCKIAVSMFCFLVTAVACDPVKVEAPQTTGTTSLKPPPEPFRIEPTVWGDAGERVDYEIRELPDGRPGLFTAEGALLFHLMPDVILDVGPAGKARTKPQRKSFDLVRLTPHDGGGFSLFGKFTDQNGKYYDLRIENGGGDPRVHVSVSTKWARDVDVHRHVVVFRTGLMPQAEALGHDYEFHGVDGEFINSAHTPNVARFGEAPAAFTAIGRSRVDGISVRDADEGRWDMEFEVHHYENEPLTAGNDCDHRELGGVASVKEGTKFEMRADLVLGRADIPLGLRFPHGRRSAVALFESGEESKARVLAAPEPTQPPETTLTRDVWFGDSVSSLPCKEGRFSTLASRGFTSAWSGTELAVERPNVFAPTEADPRRPVAFHHPNALVDADTPFVLFNAGRVPAAKAAPWFSGESFDELRDEFGAIVLATDLDALSKADASPTRTVSDSLAYVARDESVWVASVGEFSRHLHSVRDVQYDFLPHGVVRVRNPELVRLDGFSMLLPPGVAARYMPGNEHINSGSITSFDLGGRQEQLLQLFRGDEPFQTMSPANVTVSWERSTKAE